MFGNVSQTRSFCYVDDPVEAMTRMMETGDGVTGPVNLGNPGEFTMRQLAGLVLELTGSRLKIVTRPLPPDDPKQRRPDIVLAKSLLDWQPTIALRGGLQKAIAYFDRLLSERGTHSHAGTIRR